MKMINFPQVSSLLLNQAPWPSGCPTLCESEAVRLLKNLSLLVINLPENAGETFSLVPLVLVQL